MSLDSIITKDKSTSFAKLKKRLLPYFLGATIGLFGGCGGSGGANKQVKIPETTKALDEYSAPQLLTYSDDGTISFSETTEQLESLSVGDVIVSDVNGIAPNGFLRKVTNISTDSGLVLETTQATLEEAIEKGSVEISKDLTPEDIKS